MIALVRALALLLVGSTWLAGTPTSPLFVTFLDVGQADSILVQQGGHNLLIDAGNNADQSLLLASLDQRGITRLDTVIGTHAHEDHIGSMDAVIRTRDIGTLYFPHQTASTKTFKDFVSAVRAKGLKLTVPHPGERFDLGGSPLRDPGAGPGRLRRRQ